jgi:hypothetical protein
MIKSTHQIQVERNRAAWNMGLRERIVAPRKLSGETERLKRDWHVV